MRNLGIVFAMLSLAACGGGPARPQVKEIGGSDGSKVQMTYDAEKLTSVRSVDKNGTVTSSATVTYDAAQLKTFSLTSGSSTSVYTYAYDDAARLTSVDMTSGNSSYAFDATYSEGRISRTELKIVSGGASTDATTEYSYNAAGQVSERKTTTLWTLIISGVTRTTETFTYDPTTGLLKEISSKTDDNNPTLYQFTFDTSGRISKVVGGGDTYTVDYGTDGYASKTTLENGGNISYRTYTYGTGSALGVLANPLINYGELWDMAGKTLPTDQVYVSSSLMGLE